MSKEPRVIFAVGCSTWLSLPLRVIPVILYCITFVCMSFLIARQRKSHFHTFINTLRWCLKQWPRDAQFKLTKPHSWNYKDSFKTSSTSHKSMFNPDKVSVVAVCEVEFTREDVLSMSDLCTHNLGHTDHMIMSPRSLNQSDWANVCVACSTLCFRCFPVGAYGHLHKAQRWLPLILA